MKVKHNVNILFLLWMVQPPIVNALMVLKSLEPFDKPDPFPGLKLKRNSIVNDSEFSKGITFCGRFYFHRFQQVLLRTSFIQISMLKDESVDLPNLNIGGVWFKIKNGQNENNQLWITNQWQHFCLAFDADMLHVSMIKVSIYVQNGQSMLLQTGKHSVHCIFFFFIYKNIFHIIKYQSAKNPVHGNHVLLKNTNEGKFLI